MIFYGNGVLFLNLETRAATIVIPDSPSLLPRRGCIFKDGFLFTCKDDHRLHLWKSSGITALDFLATATQKVVAEMERDDFLDSMDHLE